MSIFLTTFISLTIGGILNSGYLFYQHNKKKPLVCPMNHDCSIVTESKWSKILFIRNETLGLLFFIGMLTSIILTLIIPSLTSKLLLIILISTAFGVLYSTVLIFIQIYKIKDYCFYCIISAIITLLLSLNSLYLYLN